MPIAVFLAMAPLARSLSLSPSAAGALRSALRLRGRPVLAEGPEGRERALSLFSAATEPETPSAPEAPSGALCAAPRLYAASFGPARCPLGQSASRRRPWGPESSSSFASGGASPPPLSNRCGGCRPCPELSRRFWGSLERPDSWGGRLEVLLPWGRTVAVPVVKRSRQGSTPGGAGR